MITQGCPNPFFRMDLADSKFSAAVIDSTCKRFPGCIEGNGITIEFLRQFCLSDCKTFSMRIRLRERYFQPLPVQLRGEFRQFALLFDEKIL